MNDRGERLVRAAYTDETITVYQAYSPQIAGAAVAAGTFVAPFSRERMTWIKPSFGWMMQRDPTPMPAGSHLPADGARP